MIRACLLFSCFSLALVGCTGDESQDGGAPAGPASLDATHKLRAMQIISVFENGTIELQYGYVEALGDGRGYTCGLGFTTGTGDAYEVVLAYTDTVPNNPLAVHLPRLQELAEAGSDSITGLTGFPEAWVQAADDVQFRNEQDRVQDKNSYDPALEQARGLGLKTNLGLTILYDTAWMHGPGDDPDGLLGLIDRTNQQQSSSDEAAYLNAFIAVRRADLLNPSDPATQAEWAQAVHRADALGDIVKAGNFGLEGPILIGYEYNVTVP